MIAPVMAFRMLLISSWSKYTASFRGHSHILAVNTCTERLQSNSGYLSRQTNQGSGL